MFFILRVYKMLNFCHLKFSNPNKSLYYIYTDLGAISFLKPSPKHAPANGSFPLLNSRSFAKFTKIPYAVSGRKNPGRLPVGPIEVANIKLNSSGSEKELLSLDFISYF